MKKVLFTLCGLSIVLLATAQDRSHTTSHTTSHSTTQTHTGNRNTAPTAVQQAWQRDHSNDGTATWSQSNGEWQAHYQDPTTHRNVDTYYDPSGRHVDTHREWNSSDLSPEYNQNINKHYHTNGGY